VRVSRRTSGGTSRLHGGAWPSVAAGEPVPITMILPSSAFGGVRSDNGGGDARASPHVQRSQSIGLLSSTLAIAGYEWVMDDFLKYKSSLTSVASVVALQHQAKQA